MSKKFEKIKKLCLLFILVFPTISLSANWLPVGELNANKDIFEIDYDSISTNGLRPSFYTRTTYENPKSDGLFKPQYKQEITSVEVDCDRKNTWPQNQTRLSSEGKIVTTFSVPSQNPYPILPGTQMDAASGLLCYFSKNNIRPPRLYTSVNWHEIKSRIPEALAYLGENFDVYQNRILIINKSEFHAQPSTTKLPIKKAYTAGVVDCNGYTQESLLTIALDVSNKVIAAYFPNGKSTSKVLDENISKIKSFCDGSIANIKPASIDALNNVKNNVSNLDAQKVETQEKLSTERSNDIQSTGNRRALVIGNDTYKAVAKLSNAREDARTIAANLISVGYQVTLRLDLNEKEMKATLRNFAGQVQGGDEVLFFFAGHGVQLGAANYLLPTDIVGDSEAQVRDEASQLQRVLDDMSERKAKFTLAMIDACRDNPFKSSGRAIGGRGLAPTTAATGQMVIFSAGTGQQALDKLSASDKNKNGLFTRVFIQEMQKPNQSVDRVVKNVRNQVAELAKSVGHDQVPAIYDQVLGDFFFKR